MYPNVVFSHKDFRPLRGGTFWAKKPPTHLTWISHVPTGARPVIYMSLS